MIKIGLANSLNILFNFSICYNKIERYSFSQFAKSYIFLVLRGPDGELAASLRYLSQRFTMPDNMGKALLTDIGSSATKMFHVAKFAQKPLIFGLPLLSFESSEQIKKQDKIYSSDKPFATQKPDRIRYINVYASVKM